MNNTLTIGEMLTTLFKIGNDIWLFNSAPGDRYVTNDNSRKSSNIRISISWKRYLSMDENWFKSYQKHDIECFLLT